MCPGRVQIVLITKLTPYSVPLPSLVVRPNVPTLYWRVGGVRPLSFTTSTSVRTGQLRAGLSTDWWWVVLTLLLTHLTIRQEQVSTLPPTSHNRKESCTTLTVHNNTPITDTRRRYQLGTWNVFKILPREEHTESQIEIFSWNLNMEIPENWSDMIYFFLFSRKTGSYWCSGGGDIS